MQKIEIKSGITARDAKLVVGGNEVHFSHLNIHLDVNQPNTIVISAFIKEFSFNGEGELSINNVLIGRDKELELYKQLKEKYD